MKVYETEYGKLKAARKLEWKPSLGTVSLQLSFQDKRMLEFTVAPIYAVIILAFESQGMFLLLLALLENLLTNTGKTK